MLYIFKGRFIVSFDIKTSPIGKFTLDKHKMTTFFLTPVYSSIKYIKN